MKFRKITINEWKQFQNIEIDFHERLTILTGANGSGKTTLLNLLARHFGWNFIELATPAKDETTGYFRFFSRYFKHKIKSTENVIGKITYDNNQEANLSIQDNDTAQYQIDYNPRISVKGLNIVSHREIFKYQQVPSISTKKRNKQEAYDLLNSSNQISHFQIGYYEHKPTNFYIKETLLNWAIGGSGNEFIQPDPELKQFFIGFRDVLSKLLPKSIGFKDISIRNYEIVLITDSGDFMLDAVSGGIASLIDLGWQIFNFINTSEATIVLIDEVENHLHASMQRAILPDLINTFPNVQFIVSTHSPLVVGSVKDSNVYAFRYNSLRKVYNEKLDLINKAKTATEILNEVLGVPFTMPVWVEFSLNEIVQKYSLAGISEANIDSMRSELKTIGLESLMPLAISNLFKK
jgi:predicted ATP-binding protein involved in virulence